MAKQTDDQNLFDLDLETQDIKLPGEDVSLRVPSQTQTKPGEGTKVDAPPSIRDTMLQGGEMPPIIAVDVEEGDIPQQNSVSVNKPKVETPPAEKTEQTEKTDPPAATEKTDPPAGKETEKETPPATQGQQGEPGKGTETEEKLSPTYLHAAALHEAGALPNLDLETLKELEPEDILNKINDHTITQQNEQVDARVEAYKNQFNEDQKKVLDMFDGGVAFDDAANTVYNQMRYDSVTEAQIKESPEIQEQLYREFLYAKGHNDTFINRAIKQSKELENLESDGLTSHKDLVQMAKDEEEAVIEEAKVQKQQNEQRREDNIKKIKSDVSGTTEILKGIKISKAEQNTIIDYMTKPAAEIVVEGRKVPISKMEEIRRANPIEFNKRMAYYISLGLFGDNPVLDKVEKQGETKAVNKLKDVLEGSTAPGGGKPVINPKDKKTAQGQDPDVEVRMPRQINTVRHNE
jgi:hypothetical protein